MIVQNTVMKLRRELSDARKALHFSGDPDGNHAVRAKRLGLLIQRVTQHGAVMRKLQKHRNVIFRQKAEIREAKRRFDAGQPFLCFDVEWHPETLVTHEVGFTRFDRFGYETVNLRVAGIDGIDLPVFSYGETKTVSMQTIHLMLKMAGRGVDNFVGHSIISDISHLRKEGIKMSSLRHYDTAWWSMIHEKRHMALGNLGAIYGLRTDLLHCAGNDSRFNAELFVKMIHKHT